MGGVKDYIIEHKLFFIVIPLILLITRADFEGFATSVTAFGAPLDDAYIGFQFARNLAQGRLFEYNVGEPTTGGSTFLWYWVLAGIYLVFGFFFPSYFIAFLVISKVTATILLFLSLLGIYYLSVKYYFKNKLASLFICIFLAFEFHLIWGTLSGMEMSLFAALIVWMLIAFREKKLVASAILGGLIGLTRPEGMVIFPGTIIIMLIADFIKKKKLVVKDVKELVIKLAIFALIISPWPILNMIYSGKPLPSTFYMKGGTTSLFNIFSGFPFIIDVLNLFGSKYYLPLLFIGGFILYSVIKKELSPEGLIASLFMFIYGVAIPNLTGFGRYYMPIFPLIILVAFFLFRVIESFIPAKKLSLMGKSFSLKKLAPIILMIIPLVMVLNDYQMWRIIYAHNVYSINEFEVAMAYWLLNNSYPHDIIGTTDIGAPSFIGNRYLVDTFGLINPEIRDWNATFAEYLRYRNITYFIDYPKNAHSKVQANCTIVFNTTYLPQITITAGNQMAIYKCEWL